MKAPVEAPAVELKNVTKAFSQGALRHAPHGASSVRAMDDVSLSIREGEFFALLGPSGCGKTTTLRVVAGFEQPLSGEVLIRGTSVRGVPPFHRPVNTVFQDYALFPHMSVLQNVMFGLKMAKVPTREAKKRAEETLELVQLPHVAARRPSQLSGGQRQRVALARALVNEPAVLLLDEPLGALDLKLRKTMQFELKKMQQQVGITFVFVTHDQEEALTMAERIAVMDRGRVLQVGTPAEIYENPETRFVADFIGETNFLAGTLSQAAGTFQLADGRVLPVVLNGRAPPSGPATLAIRPERIRLLGSSEGELQGGGACLEAKITEVHYLGTDTRYHLVSGGAALSVRQQNLGDEGRFAVGDEVVAFWQPVGASLLP